MAVFAGHFDSRAPLGFRATCYYYRKAYYRAFFLDPPACAVGEPRDIGTAAKRLSLHPPESTSLLSVRRANLSGHPVVRRDSCFLVYGRFGIGVGSLVLTANIVLLTLYTFSCHSLRHIVGGKVDCFSCVASVVQGTPPGAA